MKFILKLFVVIIIVLAVLVLTKNVWIKVAAEQGVSLVTGLRLHMDKLSISLLQTNVRIDGLKIYNPRDFEQPVMLDMPEILIDYNLRDILRGLIHLQSVVINMKEFNVVKNGQGKLNLDSLKVVQEGKEKKAPAEKKPAEKGKAPKFKIDNLELIIGDISFQDYSKSTAKPSINTFEMNINEKHQDITNPQILMAIIIQKALLKASAAKLTSFDLGGVSGALTNAVGNVAQLGTAAIGNVKDLGSNALGSIPAVPQAAAGSVTATGGAVVETAKETRPRQFQLLLRRPQN